ncbi:PLC-like phosphodiesterase [Xylariaceae sp. FL0662B]|nr:PLC-like phosphodiesterase [Xylariaceae sp. FL0662B]
MLNTLPSLCTVLAAVVALSGTVRSLPQAAGGSAVATASAASASSSAASTIACNNSPDLCSRSYNDITHLGAHDSSFVRDASTGNSVAGNQFFNATVALDAGVRLLQGQVHDKDGAIELCHTACELFDVGTLQNWLAGIKTWMDRNPNEVVTLLIVNSDDKDVAEFGAAFSGAGIDKYGYTPSSSGSGWPTLQEMISANTRLVTFIASITASAAYPYLLSEFDHVFETPFEVTSLSGFNCTLDRPSSLGDAGAAIEAGRLPLMNHFAYKSIISSIQIPDVDNIDTTNSPSTSATGALGRHAQRCNSQWGVKPTFVLVDFFNKGPAMDTIDTLNGISPVGRSTKALSATATVSDGTELRQRGVFSAGALVAFVAAVLVLV